MTTITLDDLKRGAIKHREHRRRMPSEYNRDFRNAEYFIAFDIHDNTPLIEPIGWALRFLEEDGSKSTRAVEPRKAKAIAEFLSLMLVKEGDQHFDILWENLNDWIKSAKLNHLSNRTATQRRSETFFFIETDT